MHLESRLQRSPTLVPAFWLDLVAAGYDFGIDSEAAEFCELAWGIR